MASRSGGETNGQWAPVGRLDRANGQYRFRYTRGAETLENFSPFAGMPDLHEVYTSDELLPLFANRLLARSRPEYEAHLRWCGFGANTLPDPLALLSVTEGRRATDAVELFACPEPDADGRYVSTFFAHGLRWLPQSAKDQSNIGYVKMADRPKRQWQVRPAGLPYRPLIDPAVVVALRGRTRRHAPRWRNSDGYLRNTI